MTRMEMIYQEHKQKLIPEYILNTPPNSPQGPAPSMTGSIESSSNGGMVVMTTTGSSGGETCGGSAMLVESRTLHCDEDEGVSEDDAHSIADDEGDIKFQI